MDEDGELSADEGGVGSNAGSWIGRDTLPTGRVSAFGALTSCGLLHGGLLHGGILQLDAVVDAVAAVAGVVEGFAEGEFGPGVLWPVRAHYAGDGFALWRGRSFVADVVDELMIREDDVFIA